MVTEYGEPNNPYSKLMRDLMPEVASRGARLVASGYELAHPTPGRVDPDYTRLRDHLNFVLSENISVGEESLSPFAELFDSVVCIVCVVNKCCKEGVVAQVDVLNQEEMEIFQSDPLLYGNICSTVEIYTRSANPL